MGTTLTRRQAEPHLRRHLLEQRCVVVCRAAVAVQQIREGWQGQVGDVRL